MFEEKDYKNGGKLNYRKLNEVIKTSKKVLKIIHILSIFVCIYVGVIVCKELKIGKIILDILGILSPLFIGLVIAWLFNPVVNFLQKKGIKRIFSVLIIYALLLGALALIVCSILPILYDQIRNFAESLPSLSKDIERVFNDILDRFKDVNGVNIESIKSNVMSQVDKFSSNLATDATGAVVSVIKGLVSGVVTFLVGLVIGFFFLLSFDNVGDTLSVFMPKKRRKELNKLFSTINGSLRNYTVGVLIDATVVFAICSIVFSLIGLKAPLLFALFCAITNVIPYAGPYIGAVPALIVGFATSPTIGLLTLIAIVIIQFFEGNFLQEMIMSKTTKLHPVTIISGLLIFGHFWGIFGMVISTPLLAVVKQIYLFLDEKYDFFKSDDEDDYEKKNKKDNNLIENKQELVEVK